MNRFKEGDIIVSNGYTYVCRIVGEKESYFEKYWFRGLFKNPENACGVSGCGDNAEFSCKDNLILFTNTSSYNVLTERANSRNLCVSQKQLHIVIGNYPDRGCYGSPYFYMDKIERYYPEEYKAYINYLHSKVEVKSSVVESSKVNKTISKSETKVKKK